MTTAPTRIAVIGHLLKHCGSLRAGETFVLITDVSTERIASLFLDAARALGARTRLTTVAVADRHGVEPPEHVAEEMRTGDLVVGLTQMSLAHTRARLLLCASGGRYLSLVGYSESLLDDPCIMADYRAQYTLTRALADAFTEATTLRVTSRAGTDMSFRIEGRVGNCCPGFVDDRYKLGSPPDIEANVSPIEDSSHGIAVIDGSIAAAEIGLLREPMTLLVHNGAITDIKGLDADVATFQAKLAAVGDENARVLAEVGIGLNPLARLTGNMLTDEGVFGSVHFGFGSNVTVGGRNDVPFHVDCVLKEASVWIDDNQVMKHGVPTLKVHS